MQAQCARRARVAKKERVISLDVALSFLLKIILLL